MPRKHSDTAGVGGPGASHKSRQNPEKCQPRGERPEMTKSPRHSGGTPASRAVAPSRIRTTRAIRAARAGRSGRVRRTTLAGGAIRNPRSNGRLASA